MQFGSSRVAKGADHIAISILIGVITLGTMAATLTPAAEWQRAKSRLWCVLCDEGSASDAAGNTLLFLPMGFVLGLASVRGARTVALAAAFSVALEMTQVVIPGRDPNVGDVIFNSAGAATGWLIAQTELGSVVGWLMLRAVRLGIFPPDGLRPFLTVGTAAGVSGVIVATCLLLRPDYPDGPYSADDRALDSTSGPLHLGGNPLERDFFVGVIDDVKIFTRARSPEEIKTGMLAPLRGAGAGSAGTDALVAAYDFDRDPADGIADTSGHGHNSLRSEASHVEGRFGKGLYFTGRPEDVVSIPAAADLNLASDLTIESWVFPTGPPRGWGNVLHKDGDSYFLSAGSDAGPLRPAAGGSFGGRIESLYAGGLLPLNAWSHLAMTYNGAALVFYVNGEPAATASRWSTARLLEASVGSSRIDTSNTGTWSTLRRNLLEGAPIRLRLAQGGTSDTLAPIVRIRDGRNRTVLVIGLESTDLVLRRRVFAARLGLMSPALRIPSIVGPRPSGEVAVNISRDANRYCVQVDDQPSRCGGIGVASGWGIFVESATAPWWLARLCSAAWMTALFIVPGFYASRLGATLAAAALLGVALAAVPGWMQVARVPAPLVVMAVAAFLAGWSLRVVIEQKKRHV